MRFISGIKSCKVSDSIEFTIPPYHRASVGFVSGAEVYYILRKHYPDSIRVRELILTPIIPNRWHLIRRVRINTVSSKGTINIITRKFSDLRINVNIEDAIPFQVGNHHALTFLIDLHDFFSQGIQGKVFTRIPDETITKLRDELLNIKDKLTSEYIIKDVFIEELDFLNRISAINVSQNEIHHGQFEQPDRQKIEVTNGTIKLPKDAINRLKLNDQKEFHYTLSSDTEGKYIKLTIFNPEQKIAVIDVHHTDKPGALAAFSDIISNHDEDNIGGYNIITSYSRQQMEKKTAHWFCMIDITKDPQTFYSEVIPKLKTCIYREKEIVNVFIVETNHTRDVELLTDETVLKYGQNIRNEDGQYTTVYRRKCEIIKRMFKENYVWTYPQFLRFVSERKSLLQGTKTKENLFIRMQLKARREKFAIAFINRLLLCATVFGFGVFAWWTVPRTIEGAVDHILVHLKTSAYALVVVFFIVAIFLLVNSEHVAGNWILNKYRLAKSRFQSGRKHHQKSRRGPT